jgi:outer-membrane receptor for ferric coprogen and ferric-rhodotorulic acid
VTPGSPGLVGREAALLAHRQICAVLLCMLFMTLACAAPAPPARYEFSIHAGVPLDEALQELARQSGIQIVFFSKITAGRSARTLSGKYTLAAALTRLLKGSELTFREVNEHTIEVLQVPSRSARVPPKAQPPVPAADDQLQEVTVSATAEQLVAMRVPTPLQEIPQTISVISSEQIREQNSFDLGDVMQNTPGIGVRQTDSLDVSGYSRGFAITSYHIDGGSALMPTLNQLTLYADADPDLSEFDHVEVLRGSDALFSSNTEPGGTVSLVRKRPLSTPSFEMSTTLGSWHNYRMELDATGPLTEDGALRALVGVVYSTRDYFFHLAHLDRKRFFTVVEYDLTPTSTLTAGGSYQWDDALPLISPIPIYSDGSDSHLPPSTSLTFPWAFYNTRIGQAYLEYRQRFADDWNLKLSTSVGRTIADYGYGEFDDVINTISHSVGPPLATFSIRPDDDTLGTMVATLTGKFDWFGMRERIAIGGDFMRTRGRQDSALYAGFGPPLTDVLTFDPQMYPDIRSTLQPLLVGESWEMLEQYGGFASLQVDMDHGWSLTSGARVASDTFRLRTDAVLGDVSVSGSTGWSNYHVLQPYNALMYRIDKHLSWYVSEADVYLALLGTALRADGAALGPEHGITFESGLKGAWRDGTLNAYLAVYRVEQRGVPVETDETSSNPFCCYSTGTGRSQGVELGVDGALAPGWLLGSGYTYNLFETGTPDVPDSATPRHLLKIWTSLRLTGALTRWTIGGNLHAQTAAPGAPLDVCNAQFQNCTQVAEVTTWQYAVLDLRVGYQLSRNWQLALSVNNVFDKRYYVSQESGMADVWYGDPRNFMFRIDAKF